MTTKQTKTAVLAGITALIALLSVPIVTAGHFDEPKVRAEDGIVPTIIQPRTIIVAGNEHPQFSPIQVSVKVGEEIRFYNVDGADRVGRAHHIVSIDAGSGIPNGLFDTGVLSVSESATIKMTEPGVYGFVDILWPSTRGAIVVEP